MNTRQAPDSDLLEHLSTAVVAVDGENRVGYLNPAAESLLRVSARQALGVALARIGPGFRQLALAVDGVRARGASTTEREQRLALPFGGLVTVDCTLTPLPDGRTVLELEPLDQQLRLARENRLLSEQRAIRELLRGLAHEIRNPLGGLRGAAQLLDRELAEPHMKEYTSVIIGEADRLRALVDGLLTPEGRLETAPTNLHEVAERVRALVEAEAPPEVEIVRDYDPSIPPLAANADQLIQALLNLMRNALQAVGDQGRIVLQTRTHRQVTIGERLHRLVARLSVVDDGPGVPPELLDSLFYPMVTGRPEGSGLGLAIAQSLVARHGGLIECTSEPGRTVFTVWLPLEDADE